MIAHKLLVSLKGERDSGLVATGERTGAHAGPCKARILQQHGYSPDLQDSAVLNRPSAGGHLWAARSLEFRRVKETEQHQLK